MATGNLITQELRAIGVRVVYLARPVQPDVLGGWDSVAVDTPCNAKHGNFDLLLRDRTAALDPLRGVDLYTAAAIPDNSVPHTGNNDSRVTLPDLEAAYRVVRGSVDFQRVADGFGFRRAAGLHVRQEHVRDAPLYTRTQVWLASPQHHNPSPRIRPVRPGNGTSAIGSRRVYAPRREAPTPSARAGRRRRPTQIRAGQVGSFGEAPDRSGGAARWPAPTWISGGRGVRRRPSPRGTAWGEMAARWRLTGLGTSPRSGCALPLPVPGCGTGMADIGPAV